MSYIQVNNTQLYYEIHGDGKDIILLHGNGGSIKDFKKLMPKLTNYKVHAIDTRGHGKSKKAKEIFYSDITLDIKEYITKKDINKPIVIGFSDGGIVALMIAINYPNLLSKIVICGANLNPQGITPKLLNKMKFINRILHSKKIDMMLKEPNISKEELEKITIPTLVLAGEKDLILEEHTKYIKDNIKNASCKILEKENHFSYVLSGRIYSEISYFIQ